jgi:predicted dehydrogenase
MSYQREFPARVRVGVVGVGSHSYRNILSALTFLPVELVAIADVNEELGARTARQYGLSRSYPTAAEMYANEDLDAVLLVVSARLHPTLAIEAFEAGLHVYMEKPAATSVDEVDAMIAARGERIASVGYKKAFMPATEKALELIDSGDLAPLRTVLGVYPMSIPSAEPTEETLRQPSQWLANGCHPLSFLLTVGGPVESIVVHRGRDDSGVLVLRHTNGVISNLHLALGAPHSQPFERYSLFGGDATLEIENTRKITFQRGIDFEYAATRSFATAGLEQGAVVWEAQDALNSLENRSEFTQGLHGGLRSFLDAVLTGTAPQRGTLEVARQIAAIYEAGFVSHDTAIDVGDGSRPAATALR